jgi:hypothetical protein
MDEFFKVIPATYGGPGLVIAGLLYAVRVLWRDNKDLRERNDRMTDRYIVERNISNAKQDGRS